MSITVQYLSPSAVRATYTVVVECISCLAFLANILLFVVYLSCPSRLPISKYLFISPIIQNLVSSICFFFTAPEAISFDWTFLLISTGRSGDWMVGPFILLLYSLTFASSMTFAADSFVHKYFQLKRPLSQTIHVPAKWLTLIIVINIAVVMNWILMNVLCGWPSKEFVLRVREPILETHNFDLISATFMGISLNHDSTSLTFILLVEALALILMVGILVLLFAVKIHLFMSRITMSNLTRHSHRQLLTLLLFQTACPVFLLHTPLYTMYGLLFTGVTVSHELSVIIGVSMASFPLMGPLITLTFVKSYREFILAKLLLTGWRKAEVSTVLVAKHTVKSRSIFVLVSKNGT